MGDPECQIILPKIETDLYEILLACCNGILDKINIKWKNKKSLCVVLCSKGYPDKYKKNVEIENIDKLKLTETDFIFHAGTSKKNEKIYATGGRVLNFVSISDEFSNAKKNTQSMLEKLNWPGGFYRKDIGYKVIK